MVTESFLDSADYTERDLYVRASMCHYHYRVGKQVVAKVPECGGVL